MFWGEASTSPALDIKITSSSISSWHKPFWQCMQTPTALWEVSTQIIRNISYFHENALWSFYELFSWHVNVQLWLLLYLEFVGLFRRVAIYK